MTNSPVPGTSKKLEPQNTPDKKKRTRRKPRSKPKSGNFVPCFEVRSLKEAPCVFYKRRDKSLKPIRINTFIIKNQIPCIFCSNGEDLNLTLNLISKYKKLSLKSKETKKNEKKRIPRAYPDYLSQEQVSADANLIKGFIRINPKNFKEAYVSNKDPTQPDYVINSVLDRNRALEGDEVLLKRVESKDGKNFMKVVHITQKIHPRTAIGFLEPTNKDYALLTPRDKRIPKMKIPKMSWPSGFQNHPQLYQNILFLAKIIDWKETAQALGVILENLGLQGDLKVESMAILREFGLDPTPYGPDVAGFLPKSSGISREELEKREDWRKECVFTIDPITARDLDDAVSCKEMSNGNLEIGVHISDASFYLEEGTLLDEKVKKKATSIYLVDTVYHMLPVELCLFCSLLPGQDKLTFSVIWEMTPSGDIVNQRITRTVINSCCQLAYEHAQKMIDNPDYKYYPGELPEILNGFKCEDLVNSVNNLQKIAVLLREKRKQSGSLKIDQVKISFDLNPLNGEPREFYIYENKPAHRLIEEFMLLANLSIAKFLDDNFPNLAFLRLHEPPKPTMMNDLKRVLETIGIHLDISTAGSIQSSLDKYTCDDFYSRARTMVLNHLLAKPMKRARYFCAGVIAEDLPFTHFALNIPIYTHFTSPIRRYADIMVHRLLAASLKYQEPPNWQPEDVATMAEICNMLKYNAKRAGDASTDLYLAHYIEKREEPFIKEAVVVDVKERSIDILVLETGSVVRIYTNNFGKGVEVKSEEIKLQSEEENVKKLWKMLVKFPKEGADCELVMVLEIFTVVRVELSRIPKSNKLEGKLLRPVQLLALS